MTPPEIAKARRHLMKSCDTLGPVVKDYGPCTMTFNPDSFTVLCRAIVGQQLSTKAAASINTRVLALLGGKYQPQRFEKVADPDLRGCGLSNGKVKFLRDLVDKVNDSSVPIKKLPKLSNDDVRTCLIAVKGIGPWTVDMFLMFGLGRPDVLPVGDLGIRVAIQRLWNFKDLPTPTEMTAIAEPWQPYRTLASWYLWRTLEKKCD
jgi:DNA-3-methyladenine glycosylase II